MYNYILIFNIGFFTFLWFAKSCEACSCLCKNKAQAYLQNTGENAKDGYQNLKEEVCQFTLNEGVEAEPFTIELEESQMLLNLAMGSVLAPLVPHASTIIFASSFVYYLLQSYDMGTKSMKNYYTNHRSLSYRKTFMLSCMGYVSGLCLKSSIESKNITNESYSIPLILVEILIVV